jgi:hypothetical protein
VRAPDARGAPGAAPRVAADDSAAGIEQAARERGEPVRQLFEHGGPPVALTETSLWLADEEQVYRLPREDVQALGQIRSTDYSRMRWGIGLYLLALIAFFLHWVLTGLLLIAGGALVVLGFLAKALLVQVEDDRVPPFVIEHREWKQIRSALDAWHDRDEV